MALLPLYLRREPTTDATAVRHLTPAQRAKALDVVAYRDEAMTVAAARWPYHFTRKPRRNCRTIVFNCYRWSAVWPSDLEERV